MTTEQIITLVVGLGTGGLLRELVVGIWHWATGRQTAERSAVQQAWRDLDSEMAYRRRVSEHAHELRTMLIAAGVDELPPFPSRTGPDDNP